MTCTEIQHSYFDQHDRIMLKNSFYHNPHLPTNLQVLQHKNSQSKSSNAHTNPLHSDLEHLRATNSTTIQVDVKYRSEERRVGKECLL